MIRLANFSVLRMAGIFASAMLVCATSVSAQWADSSRVRVLIFPAYDKQGWAVAHALNRELISKSKTAVVDIRRLEHEWATGGAFDVMFASALGRATGGHVIDPHDRRFIALSFNADMLVSLVPDSLRPDSATNVLISTKRTSVEVRNIGTWVVKNSKSTAKEIYKAIRADTAFQRLVKQDK